MTDSGQKTTYQRMFEFFCKTFSVSDFFRFFRFIPYAAQLTDSLPGEGAPKNDIIGRGVNVLIEHGLFNDDKVWYKLVELRPKLAPVIQQLAAEFGLRLSVDAAVRVGDLGASNAHFGSEADRSLPSVLEKIQTLQHQLLAAQAAVANGRTEHVFVESAAHLLGKSFLPPELTRAANQVSKHVKERSKAQRSTREIARAKALCGEAEVLFRSADGIACFGQAQAKSWISVSRRLGLTRSQRLG